MQAESTTKVLKALDRWIKHFEHPAAFKHWLKPLRRMRSKIAGNPEQISLLVDGNIWGGQGSLIDGASWDISHFRPTVNDPGQRAAEWESASKRCHEAHLDFTEALVQLGTAILEAKGDAAKTDITLQLIQNRVGLYEEVLARKYQPLTTEVIQQIERESRPWYRKLFER